MTNRHVLQEIADTVGGGEWRFRDGVYVDFGHEFPRARECESDTAEERWRTARGTTSMRTRRTDNG
jgi:hypothetical protein